MKIICSFLLTLIITTNLYTQNAVYTVPSVLIFNNTHYKDTSIEIENLTDSFRPIGFSKTGNFAYVIEPADEACGCYFFEIYIINNKNKVLYQYRYRDENKYNEQRETEEKPYATIDTVWQQYGKLFNKKLAQYGIVQQLKFEFATLPTKKQSPNLYYTAKPQYYKSVDFDTMVKKYTLYQTKNVKGKAMLFKAFDAQIAIWQKDRKLWFSVICDATSLGYISNPYLKSKGVFIHNYLQRGWEGAPHVSSFVISSKNN